MVGVVVEIAVIDTATGEVLLALGEDHPSTLYPRGNLAGAYQAAGDLGRAISLFEQTLADSVRVLGKDHPETKIVHGNLSAARQQPQ